MVWVLLGLARVQGEFLASRLRRLSFLAVMLAAVTPDFDVFVPNAHRLYTHSLVFPALFAIVGVALYSTRQPRITYLLSWAMGFQWACHLLLDMDGFPPMGLFWPFSPLCFAFTVIVTGGEIGGMPIISLQVYVLTAEEWLTWGRYTLTSPWSISLGVPLLTFILFLLTAGRQLLQGGNMAATETSVKVQEDGVASRLIKYTG